jgi:hypothetical protein
LVLPPDKIRLLYVIPFTFCAPLPLKLTVFGVVDVTLSVPADMVRTLAMPSTALVESLSSVPLSVTLYRLAVPLSVELPVNVATEADDDEKVPLTFNAELILKLTVVVTEPLMVNALNDLVPLPEMVFDVPLMVIVPLLADKEPATERFPVTVKDDEVLMLPDNVRLSNTMLLPEIDFELPLMVTVPEGVCVNAPDPVVLRLPAIFNAETVEVIPEAVMVRLLKLQVPLPEMSAEGPVREMVLVLPVSVPLMLMLPKTV